MSEERITYDEFMIMLKFAPKMCYTLYDKAEDEIDRLNNIINELENDLKKRKHTYENMNASINGVAVGCFTYVLKKLQELKDSD